ncbi:hypothetical protein [Streptomyces sp. NPDC005799]|uniref:hypothetical protein n=1 Tax=Streptomyces sp. NPDC005799 TaxID=3154678 RepID=UPI0033CD4EAF
MTLISPTVALLIPPAAQAWSDSQAERKDDKRWEKTKKDFQDLMADPWVSPEDKDGLTKAWEQAKAHRAQRLLERAERKSKSRWSMDE